MVLPAMLAWPAVSFGQDAPSIDPNRLITRAAIARSAAAAASDVRFDLPHQSNDPRRACDGCPVRRLWRPVLESLAVNVMYNGINHARGHATSDVSPRSWWANMKHGFEWDMNTWFVNEFGHPYQGSNYFTAGRANGLSFWEASALAAFGSGTWEFFFENNRASLNDFINTTLGGIALGEVLHRSAWLVRNPAKSGQGRREVVAAMIDPMSGLERAMSGDWSRVVEKPRDLVPSSLAWRVDAGVMVQGVSLFQSQTTALPFIDTFLYYGDVRTGRTEKPFDAFTLEFAAGASLAHAQLRGRLFSAPFGKDDTWQTTVFQTYDFIRNTAYDFGGQGFEAEVSTTRTLSSRWKVWLAGTGGATVLGAANSVLQPVSGVELPRRSEDRTYDYGPGARFGGDIEFRHRNRPVTTLDYQAFHVNVVDGTRANHILQRVRLDVRVPITQRLAVGTSVEYFFRKAYFWFDGQRSDQSPQARVFVSWNPAGAFAQQPTAPRTPPASPPPPTPPFQSRLWIVGGSGFAVARAGCGDCDREGLFHKSYSFIVDGGMSVNPRVDAGVELYWVSLKVNGEAPIRTTFVLGVVQMRPWVEHGLLLKAGMGIGIAGNGLFNPAFPKLKPPYTTNALAITFGTGWEFKINRRWALQVHALQHVAALGELNTEAGERIRNVVGNYWTIGGALVIR